MEPTQQAWQFFLENLPDIRKCVEKYAQRPDYMMAFDKAVEEKDRITLMEMMNDAWEAAPDDAEVYDQPGFREMSDLLDGSVPGFVTAGDAA